MGVMMLIEELERLRTGIDGMLSSLAQQEAAAQQQANESANCAFLCFLGGIIGGVGGGAACFAAIPLWACVGAVGLGILSGAAVGDWLAGKLTSPVNPNSTFAGGAQGEIDRSIGATLTTLQGLYSRMSQAGDMTSLVRVDEYDVPLIVPFPNPFDFSQVILSNPDGLEFVRLNVSVNW